ncbi:MAG TPA: hypothetical protein VLF71_03490 [Candidatus Saccharimonadales bacterium]|nr:hypothetical protein [Candidatus Saccharimonadales bacterium]
MSEHLGKLLKGLEAPAVLELGGAADSQPLDYGRVTQQLDAVAAIAMPQLVEIVAEGMAEWPEGAASHVVHKQVEDKLLIMYVAPTNAELPTRLLAAGTTAVGGMYFGDQTGDRGDWPMTRANATVGLVTPDQVHRGRYRDRLSALGRIEGHIKELARPEDVPYVLSCFYDQVLRNEAYMQLLSRQYLRAQDRPAFLAAHAAHLADVTTVSAGFPSVASSWYAIQRQEDPSLAPLSEIYSSTPLKEMLQACNATVRIWDELGDWRMDTGADPSKGVFVINPLNEYHPAFVGRYCKLAFLQNPKKVAALQYAFANFHGRPNSPDIAAERQTHTAFILETFRTHIRDYMAAVEANLPPMLHDRYRPFLTHCRRVLKIGYINSVGDIAMMRPSQPTA